MTREIGRRLIGGVWRTGQRDETDGNGGGGSQTVQVIGPIPVAYDSPNIETTGFPVLDVSAGDIVIGWGANIGTVWGVDDDFANASLKVTDSSGITTVNGGTNSFADPNSPADADAVTLFEVFDGWTLIPNDTQLVLVVTTSDGADAGAADIYIVLMRPTAP